MLHRSALLRRLSRGGRDAVSAGAPGERATALLTRTTLQTFGDASAPSLAAFVRALQRVPGVLLAELQAAGARVIVMHDAGVPSAAFATAAATAGIRAAIVAPQAPVAAAGREAAAPLQAIGAKHVAAVAVALVVTMALLEMLLPHVRP
jgi:hypothetical protein